MLHRVVMKRSGRRAVAEDASGFTAADHLICTIVRQARNFPARCWNTCTLRVDQPPPKAAPSPEATARFLRRLSQIRMPRSNCYRHSRTRFPAPRTSRRCRGKHSASLRGSTATIFSIYGTALRTQSSQCPGPIVPSLYSVRVSVRALVWLGDK